MKQKHAERFIKQAVQKVVERFHPKKMILFGSYASGTATRNSDIDLLIIFPKSGNRARRYVEISRELEPMLLPIDLLIRSAKDIQYRLKIGDSFIAEIINKGKILYEC